MMEQKKEPVAETLKQYGRGIGGGLIFSLPMLYTMELWWAGFLAGPLKLMVYLVVGILLLTGYNHFVGLRRDHSIMESIMESLEEMGLAFLITALILWFIGRLTPGMSLHEIIGKTVVESLTVAIGISIGKAQLGSNGSDTNHEENNGIDAKEEGSNDGEINLLKQLAMAFCGSVIVAANVAPTEEIVMIALGISHLKLALIAFFSIGLGGAILYHVNLKGAERSVAEPETAADIFGGTIIMYGVALVASAFMLWFFGRFEYISLPAMTAEIVVLGLPSALGASAGRLLLQS
ncbi:MAG TPA: TIGR02587 family membrane protein [Pricia sp.]|nr:TIGR02587 family membrane protein [Pricia sp.]